MFLRCKSRHEPWVECEYESSRVRDGTVRVQVNPGIPVSQYGEILGIVLSSYESEYSN